MAPYIEDDVQNTLINFQNRITLAITATQNGVPHSTLRNCGNNIQSHRHTYEDLQRLLTV